MSRTLRANLVTLVLIAPALLLLLAVFVWPMGYYGWLSLQAQSVFTGLEPVPVGLANWQRLLGDARFWQDAAQTLRFSGVSVGLELLLGLAIALVLHQRWPARGVVRSLTLLPWALPTTVMALGWRWIFNDPNGPINGLLQSVGLATLPFLASPQLAWIAAVVADVWKTTPFVALVLLAGLQMIPADLYEALALEGGHSWQALWRITLPLLRPYIFLVLLFRLAQALGVFDLIAVLTGGGPAGSTESLAVYAYLNAMRFLDFGYSATVMLGMFLLLLLSALLLLLWRRAAEA
ncbi:carbohydrate ABC transporter permease [Synechococcus sp. CS-1328]|uniref:carbohydrate ABC transporter permease n=1 Tax=Synechococcus sp. CS-1328 TaxID=2847976 RepID=UPI00223AF488|nr:sugar ABC transporter permease [Synechococcus sp. CS-1328]MCT0225047.1 sugar ABC transporter permease [Synechococcus sp. CS-1328]